MQLPSINISSVHGKIGLQTERPHIQVKQHHADLSIKQEHAVLQINQQPSKLSIDQREAFASANLKHVFQLNKDWAAKAMQNVSQAIVKYAREGEQLKRIENGGNPIPHLAKENSILFPEKQLTMVQMPRHSSVKIHYQPGQLSIGVKGGTVDVRIDKREPTIQHRPWQTSAYIRQKNDIQFQVVGAQVNRGL